MQILYLIIKGWVWLSLRLFYHEIQIKGLENVPKDQPVIFIANHFNTLLDPLLIVTTMKSKIWFLTRSDVFKKSRIAKVLNFLGSIPTYRATDGFKAPLLNQGTFDKCQEILAKNGCIALFPEATHYQHRTLRNLKKGVLRIWEQNQNALVVPVGLNFSNISSSKSKVGISFGDPISYRSEITTHELKAALSQEVVTVENCEEADPWLNLPWSKKHVNSLLFPPHKRFNWRELQETLGKEPNLVLPFNVGKYIFNLVLAFSCIPLSIMALVSEIPFKILLSFVLKKFKDGQFHVAIHWFLKHLWITLWIFFGMVIWISDGLFSGKGILILTVLLGNLVLPLFKRQVRLVMAQIRFILLSKPQQEALTSAIKKL